MQIVRYVAKSQPTNQPTQTLPHLQPSKPLLGQNHCFLHTCTHTNTFTHLKTYLEMTYTHCSIPCFVSLSNTHSLIELFIEQLLGSKHCSMRCKRGDQNGQKFLTS